MFIRIDKNVKPKTVIAGFGKCKQAYGGGGRYLCGFATGIHFWSHNQDVSSRQPFEVGKWQMLTATYDGKTVRVYKDAKKIGQRDVQLADDENVVNIAPEDPWGDKNRFEGQIREFSIWPTA